MSVCVCVRVRAYDFLRSVMCCLGRRAFDLRTNGCVFEHGRESHFLRSRLFLTPPQPSLVRRLVRGDAERFFPKPSANRIKHRQRGVVAMANNGADMHGYEGIHTFINSYIHTYVMSLNDSHPETRVYRYTRSFATVLNYRHAGSV